MKFVVVTYNPPEASKEPECKVWLEPASDGVELKIEWDGRTWYVATLNQKGLKIHSSLPKDMPFRVTPSGCIKVTTDVG